MLTPKDLMCTAPLPLRLKASVIPSAAVDASLEQTGVALQFNR